MTIKRHVLAGLLTTFLIFFLSWVVTKATAHELPLEAHELYASNGMDVPQKGTTNQYWAEWFGENPFITEPNRKFISDWKINEVPRNVTVYYDVNGDGYNDLVFAHPIVAENQAPSCDKPRQEQATHWLFTTCPNNKPPDYFVVHKYSMFRILNQHTCTGCPLK